MKQFKCVILLIIASFFLFAIESCKSCNSKKNNGNNDSEVVDSISDIDKISLKIRENPRQHSLFFTRAGMYYKLGLIDDAINDMEIALKLDSLNPIYLITISDYYLLKGKSEKTKEALDRCLMKYPQNIDARFKLAQLYFYVKDYDKAMSEIAYIEKAGKQSDKTYYLKALIYKEINVFSGVVENLRKVLEYNPNHFEAYNMLGMLYYEKNDKLAVEYFNTAVKLFPDNMLILLNAGLVYEKFNMLDLTRQAYEHALQIDSTDYQANFHMGYYLVVYTDEYKQAIKYFNAAIAAQPKSVEAYYNRGFAFESMGDFKEATNDYHRAMQIVPNYEMAIQGLNRIDKKR